MAGGLLQLVAYGVQDTFLSSNPQVTFFKLVYRRHTNFAMESIRQPFNSDPDFGKRVTCEIPRHGDLIHRMYLQVTLPALENYSSGPLDSNGRVDPATIRNYKWARRVGLALIKTVDIEIGGQLIDRHYGEWMYIWNELSLPTNKLDGYNKMIGYCIPPEDISDIEKIYYPESPATKLFIPLEFWFCQNHGLALPLIALQYDSVKLNIEFRNLSELHREANNNKNKIAYPIPYDKKLGETVLWIDYIFLDVDERRRFSQSKHEYLIEQVQTNGEEKIDKELESISINLKFTNPVKELFWVFQYEDNIIQNQWFNYINHTEIFNYLASSIMKTAKLQLNGNDRFSEREAEYFALVQPFQHHTNIPNSRGIHVYSFALKPEEHQPSGSLNFSRLDSVVMKMTLDNKGLTENSNSTEFDKYGNYIRTVKGTQKRASRVRFYAKNYNVLRIMSGTAGLAYAV
jgi:hypothetical protein